MQETQEMWMFPELGGCLEERHANPLQYPHLENAMDRRAWWAAIHGVAKSQTWLKQHSMKRMKNSFWVQSLVTYFFFQGHRNQRYPSQFSDKCRFFTHLGGSESKESAGDQGSIPGWGRFPGEGTDNPLQDSCLENFMDRWAWCCSPWGCKESDMTEQLTNSFFISPHCRLDRESRQSSSINESTLLKS